MSLDPTYCIARAIEERHLAMACEDDQVRRVHLELAAEYTLEARAQVTSGNSEPHPGPEHLPA